MELVIKMLEKELLFSLLLSFKIIVIVIPFLLLASFTLVYVALEKNKFLEELIDLIINIPIIFPPICIGFFLVNCFGKNSFFAKYFGLELVFSFEGICLAGFLAGLPLITRTLMAGLKDNVLDLCTASYTLGKTKFKTFIFIVLPELKKNIISGLILAIGRIIGEVGITLMIGGNITGKTNTISLEIYNSVLDGEYNKAFNLSIILFIFSFFIFFLLKIFNRDLT